MKLPSFFLHSAIFLLLTVPVPLRAGEIWIEWTPNSESDLLHYFVCRSNTSKPQPDLPGDLVAITEAPFYIDRNVLAAETYFYWIAAVDSCGNTSTFSGPLSVTVESAQGPETSPGKMPLFEVQHVDEDQDPADPFIDRTLDNDDQLDFSWTALNPDVALYGIYLIVDRGGAIFMEETSATAYSLENPGFGKTYCLRVDVYDAQHQLIARGYSGDVQVQIGSEPLVQPDAPEALDL